MKHGKKILKGFGIFWLVIFTIVAAIYISFAMTKGKPASAKAIFEKEIPRPLVFAHRGGGGLFPENTLEAFKYSAEIGVDVLELDIHGTSDGKLVVMHDSSVERTTDGSGKVSELTLEQLKKLDAGFKFTTDGGKTFPFRGKNITVPTLEEVFAAFPSMTFNVEPKQNAPSITKPLCGILRERNVTGNVIVGSFRQEVLDEFRAECAEVATSASPSEVSKFLAMYKTGLSDSYTPPMQALQVPENVGYLNVVSKDFVETAHRLNLKVHVWTINKPDDMQRLLEMGVDGIMTDYPDRLLNLLDRTIIVKDKN
ncbi:MAG: glycerophosphodiester phosphodiesterase [Pyrinomonadaceae bacterium]